jgi:hypothetical protein
MHLLAKMIVVVVVLLGISLIIKILSMAHAFAMWKMIVLKILRLIILERLLMVVLLVEHI